MYGSTGRRRRRPRPKEDHAQLQERVDETARASEILKGRAESLKLGIERVRAAIIEEKRKKRAFGGVHATTHMHQQARRKQVKLQARLDHASTLHEEAKGANDDLVREINALRRERMIFEETLANLQAEFHSKQQEMGALMDASNLFQESRVEALAMLSALRSADLAERTAFKKEWEELSAVVEDQAGKQNHVMRAGLRQRANRLEEQLQVGDLDPEEEALIKARLGRLAAKAKADGEAARRAQAEYVTYDEAFAELKRVGESDDVGVLVENFLENEDQNFKLFDQIAGMNEEIERSMELKRSVEEQMHKYKHDQGKHESNRKRLFHKMEQRLERAREQCEQCEQRRSMAEQVIQDLGEATDRLFHTIGCNRMPGMELFRDPVALSPNQRMAAAEDDRRRGRRAPAKAGAAASPPRPGTLTKSASLVFHLGSAVHEENIMLYLGLIEQRADELTQSFRRKIATEQAVDERAHRRTQPPPVHGPAVPVNLKGTELSVTLPSLEDTGAFEHGKRSPSGKDDPERPLSLKEIRRSAFGGRGEGRGEGEGSWRTHEASRGRGQGLGLGGHTTRAEVVRRPSIQVDFGLTPGKAATMR